MSGARSVLVSCAALALLPLACAKIVGITDTEVSESQANAGSGGLGGMGGATVNVANAGAGGSGGAPQISAAGMGGMGGMSGMGGSAGSPPMTPMPDAGMSMDAGSTAACVEQAGRCAPTGREVCGSGIWQPDPCPVNQPTCQGDGECIARGPVMISVGGVFFIDATEVTVAQYGEFLSAKGSDTSGQSAVCSWNQSYYEGPVVMDPANYPMASVDWCDAAAYCSWAGKHMCGRIGGGPIAHADIFDPNLSQWFVACGGPGGGTHPNNASTCNSGTGTVAAVGSYASCEGYFPGIFDMEGNVAEWVDNCDGSAGADDTCYPMGGGIFDNGSSFCTEAYDTEGASPTRDGVAVSYGFRCCAG